MRDSGSGTAENVISGWISHVPRAVKARSPRGRPARPHARPNQPIAGSSGSGDVNRRRTQNVAADAANAAHDQDVNENSAFRFDETFPPWFTSWESITSHGDDSMPNRVWLEWAAPSNRAWWANEKNSSPATSPTTNNPPRTTRFTDTALFSRRQTDPNRETLMKGGRFTIPCERTRHE